MPNVPDTTPRLVAKLLRWLLVGLVFGLLPVILKAVFIVSDETTLTRQQLLGDGELFLVAAGLAAAGIGDLLFEIRDQAAKPQPAALQVFRAVAVILAVIVALLGAAIYGSSWDSTTPTNTYMTLSITVLVAATVCSLACVVIADQG